MDSLGSLTDERTSDFESEDNNVNEDSDLSPLNKSKGIGLSFYKSSSETPERKVTPNKRFQSFQVKKNSKRKDDQINKGVGHKIKKPKITKAKLKKLNQAKKCVSRLREIKMPPRIPMNRSPIGTDRKIKHALSSPGFSLLDSPDAGDFNEETSKNKKKFFTSRSREAATVQISKTIKLSAMDGNVKMTQRKGGFEKKNIGRTVELELEKSITAKSLQLPITKNGCSSFPSMSNGEARPVPTRFPCGPSPRKLSASLERTPKRLTPLKSVVRSSPGSSPLKGQHNSPLRRSPRKSALALSPSRSNSSPLKQLNAGSNPPSSPFRTGDLHLSENEDGELQDLDLALDAVCPPSALAEEDLRLLSLLKENATPEKLLQSPRRTPKKMAAALGKSRSSPRLKAKVSENVKYFPIFNKDRKLKALNNPEIPNRNDQRKEFVTKGDSSQMIIDAGQKNFGATYCGTCGLLYEVGNPEDEASHKKHHDSLFTAIKFPRLKNENQVTTVDADGGRVLKVSSQDTNKYWKKANEVLQFVDQDLGFAETEGRDRTNTFVFLYVVKEQITGCLVAEGIDKAYRIIPQSSKNENLLCCSDVPQKVSIGISRIWVLASSRRKNIATKLVDAMKLNIIHGHFLTNDEIAFSDPTMDGVSFAKKYCEKPDFLVYRRN